MIKKEHQESRRDFLKKAAYTAPVILTMAAAPAFARNGSPHACDRDSNKGSYGGNKVSYRGNNFSYRSNKGSKGSKGSHRR
jgi:hypothetical protein